MTAAERATILELQRAIIELSWAIIWYRAVLPYESWKNVPCRFAEALSK